jgi:prepilin signal peptidase PulO-like enzyme (type II secretory pathway)
MLWLHPPQGALALAPASLLACALALLTLQPWLLRRLLKLLARDIRAARAGVDIGQHRKVWPWLAALIVMGSPGGILVLYRSGLIDAPMAILLGGLALACAMIAIVDWRCLWIPDALSWPLAACGVAAGFMLGIEAWVSLAGFAGGFLSFALLRRAFLALRGYEGLGGGDVKLAAAMGAWLGPFDLPLAIGAAALLALLVALPPLILAQKTTEYAGYARLRIPFGAFLALALLLVVAARLAGA